ncbi:MAG: hypothetical protein NTV08_00610 [Verrucomicrobia bacterium]|nr:hypothetical protein [Verrucomicrobiota bacterium]
MKTHRILALVAAACAILLTSCASGPKGPTYTEAKQTGALVPKKDKGLVLVYWKPHPLRAAFYRVYANDELITTKMRLGHFYAYDAAPGELRLASTGGSGDAGKDVGTVAAGSLIAGGPLGFAIMAPLAYAARKKDRAGLNIVPSETYYVEMYTGFTREQMRQVSKEAAEKGIEKCRWLNPTQGTLPQS